MYARPGAPGWGRTASCGQVALGLPRLHGADTRPWPAPSQRYPRDAGSLSLVIPAPISPRQVRAGLTRRNPFKGKPARRVNSVCARLLSGGSRQLIGLSAANRKLERRNTPFTSAGTHPEQPGAGDSPASERSSPRVPCGSISSCDFLAACRRTLRLYLWTGAHLNSRTAAGCSGLRIDFGCHPGEAT